jgi:RNA polymerase sigma factor (sigma-70 family)
LVEQLDADDRALSSEHLVDNDTIAQISNTADNVRELVASAISGDERAFNALYERYRTYAWGVALRTTGNVALAEEAVVDGFASAFQSLARIEDPARFQSYLASCVRNEIYTQVKRRSRDRSAEMPEDFTEEDAAFSPAGANSPESVLMTSDDGEKAFAALQRLDDRQQLAIYLVEVEEFSADEAARTMGVTANALHQLLFRARRSLRLQFIAPALDGQAPQACRDCNDSLAAYVRGAARSESRQRVERHLAECSSCQGRLENATETNELIMRAGAVVPAGLGIAVAAKVGFSRVDPSSALKVNRFTSFKHFVIVHPVKTVGILVATAALVTAGVVVTSRSHLAPTSDTKNLPTAPAHSISHPRSGVRFARPSSVPAAPVMPLKATAVKATTGGAASEISQTSATTTTAVATYSPPVFSSSLTPDGPSGYTVTAAQSSPINASLTATSPGGPVTLSLSGQLPEGVTFTPASGGVATVSGVPSVTGIYQVDVTAAGSTGTTTVAVTVTVTAPPVFTSSSTVDATVGRSVTFPITASGFPKPAYSTTGALPPGLRLVSGSGDALTVVGTPIESGTWNLSVTATNSVRATDQSLTIVVT